MVVSGQLKDTIHKRISNQITIKEWTEERVTRTLFVINYPIAAHTQKAKH